MLDLVISGGKIIDGSGAPWFRADLGIADGRIVSLGRLKGQKSKKRIVANDLVVSPGFIDIHTHSDLTLLVNGRAESKIRQGVTTEVIGNCGYSPAPVAEKYREELAGQLKDDYNLELTWSSFPEYIEHLKSSPISVNVVPLVGHGALRAAVLGYENRPATPAELSKMKGLLKEAIAAGAAGFSSGLIYPPSAYADSAELVELARVAAEQGGIYTTHMRYEGAQLIEGVREAIMVGEKSGIPVQISHHKVTDRGSWGLVSGSLRLIEQARRRGVDLSCDLYPYLATATGLSATLPDWAHQGGLKAMLARLVDPTISEEIRAELVRTQQHQGWENIVISSVHNKENQRWEGLDLKSISEELDLEPAEAVLEILVREKGRVGMIRFAMCEDDLKTVLRHHLTMIGSDGSSRADYGILARGKPHPRNFGTFPRVLGKYVREEGVISLEEAINKMTGLPAWRLGLARKGLLREGMDADLTIFDPDQVIDRATFLNPLQYPTGIKQVIVAGQIVVTDNEHTGVKPGQILL